MYKVNYLLYLLFLPYLCMHVSLCTHACIHIYMYTYTTEFVLHTCIWMCIHVYASMLKICMYILTAKSPWWDFTLHCTMVIRSLTPPPNQQTSTCYPHTPHTQRRPWILLCVSSLNLLKHLYLQQRPFCSHGSLMNQ